SQNRAPGAKPGALRFGQKKGAANEAAQSFKPAGAGEGGSGRQVPSLTWPLSNSSRPKIASPRCSFRTKTSIGSVSYACLRLGPVVHAIGLNLSPNKSLVW